MFYSQDIYGRPLVPFGFSSFPIAQNLPVTGGFLAQDPRLVSSLPLTGNLIAQDPRFSVMADPRLFVDPRLATIGVDPRLAADPRLGSVAVDPRLAQSAAMTVPQGISTLPLLGSFFPQIPQVASGFAPISAAQQTLNPLATAAVHPATLQYAAAQSMNPWALSAHQAALQCAAAAQSMNPWALSAHQAALSGIPSAVGINPWTALYPQTLQYPFYRSAYVPAFAQNLVPTSTVAGCLV